MSEQMTEKPACANDTNQFLTFALGQLVGYGSFCR